MKMLNKLVRDKIPDIILQQGGQPEAKSLTEDAYIFELDRKLNEEVEEYQQSKELEELADVLEVIDAICKARGYTVERLHQIKEKKRLERGGFDKKVFLVSTKEV